MSCSKSNNHTYFPSGSVSVVHSFIIFPWNFHGNLQSAFLSGLSLVVWHLGPKMKSSFKPCFLTLFSVILQFYNFFVYFDGKFQLNKDWGPKKVTIYFPIFYLVKSSKNILFFYCILSFFVHFMVLKKGQNII